MKSRQWAVLLNHDDSMKVTGVDNPRNIRENKMHNFFVLLFQTGCLSLLHLTVPLRFYLVPSSGTYSFAVSFCLAFCDCDFYSAGCKVIVLAGAVSQMVDKAV